MTLNNEERLLSVATDITDRKQAAENLRREKDYADSIIETAHAIILVLDLQGRIVSFNPYMEEICGYSIDQVRGKDWFETFLPKRASQQIRELFKNALNDIQTQGNINPIVTKDGREVEIEWYDKTIKDSNGNVTGVIAVGQDITERKKAELAIKESEEKHRALFESSRDAIMVASADKGFLSGNQAVVQLFGCKDVEEFTSLSPADVSPQYQPDGTLSALKAQEMMAIAMKEGSHFFEWKHKKIDGTEFFANVFITRMELKNQKVLLATVRDITDSKQAQAKLEDSYETLQKILDSMPFGVIVVDRDKCIRQANETAVKISGYNSHDELVGQLCHKTLCPAQKNKCPIIDMNQQVNQSEKILVTKDGNKIPILKSVIPINIGNEEVLLEAFVDISDLKKERRQKERLEAQIRQTQKIDALGTLAGGIAHDFNNILASLIGYTNLAKDDIPEKTTAHKNLDEVLTAASRAKKLVKQILTFSRKKQTELLPVKIKNILEEALKMLRATLPATIEFRHNIGSESTILADETQIHQVIVNLCTNAVHAMEDNEGTLEVKLMDININSDTTTKYGILRQGKYVRLTVKDNGCGMDSEDMEKIFEPFYTTKEPGKGTGLGLSVIHGIVKSHKGTITVDSKLRRGTTFKIYLPSVIDAKITEAHEQQVILGNSEHILFIDDEKPIVDMAEQMLQKLGYKVTAETSSTEALKLFQQQPDKFDLVITDQMMPKLKGLQLAKNILDIRPDIPIILCTGYSEEIDQQAAKDIGIKQLVFKPMSKEEISNIIHEILELKWITV